MLSLLFLFSTANSADFNVTRSTAGKLIMEGSCREIESEVAAVRQWGVKTTGGDCAMPAIREGGEGMCTSDITTCMPEHVRRYHGLTSEIGGPNCWNFALVAKGLLPTLRETSPEEWEFYLTSPLCQAVPDGEKPQPGDIGSLEQRTPIERRHVHGFVHISENMVFNKLGTLTQSPYVMQSYEDMHKTYPKGALPAGECESECGVIPLSRFIPRGELSSIPSAYLDATICPVADKLGDPRIPEACRQHAERVERNREPCARSCTATSLHYFRCKSWDEYLADVRGKGREAYDHMDQLLKGAECTVEHAVFETGALTPAQSRSIEDTVAALAAYAEQELKNTQLSEKERVAVASLVLRLDGMGTQMNAQTNRLAELISAAKSQLSAAR